MVAEGRRKAQGGIDLDAARSVSHSSVLAAPAHNQGTDAEQERYEQEMAAYEQKRQEARRSGTLWAFSETPPKKPKKKQVTPIPPF